MRIFFILSLFFHTLFAVDDLDNALRLYEGNKFVKAYEIFERLCEEDNARACFSLAYMNENAQGELQEILIKRINFMINPANSVWLRLVLIWP